MSNPTLPDTMAGVLLHAHGGLDTLEYRTDLPLPEVKDDEVLIKVAACAVNNTDINTRIGWYSKDVVTDTATGGTGGFDKVNDDDASWSGIALHFPRIQGADCCGEIVATGKQVDPKRVGERVLVRSMQDAFGGDKPYHCITFGSECDGGFAEYTTARAVETYAIQSSLSDAELASFPCAYSTAENMIDRAGVTANDTVLVTGSSGGVGSAAVQLAKRRGAKVIAVCGTAKMEQVRAIGADAVIARGSNVVTELGSDTVDVVIDLVAGPQWEELLTVLRRGGRYAVAGAIAGPLVNLDVRTLYLKDLSFFGCTYQSPAIFKNLVSYIEKGELKPLVAKEYPLRDIVQAQETFLEKQFLGKLVLLP